MTVRSWKNPGVGFTRHNGAQQRIIIGLDPETFMQVRRRAKAAGTSFAEQVRVLVEFGLETARADDETADVSGLARPMRSAPTIFQIFPTFVKQYPAQEVSGWIAILSQLLAAETSSAFSLPGILSSLSF